MENINKIIKSLNNKNNSIKSKSNLSEKDLEFINVKIQNLRDNLKEYSNKNRLTDITNKTVTNILKSTVKTVLSTPTKNNKTYNMKKKFLSEVPQIIYVDLGEYPSSYTKNYMNTNNFFMGGACNLSDVANVPGNTYLNAPTKVPTFNAPKNPGVVGCLSNVNGCGVNRLTSFAEGNIGCSNMADQGGQKFLFPQKIIDRQ